MRAHVIEAGLVTNTIQVEDLSFLPNLVDADLGGVIGDAWDGKTFTTPAVVVTVPEVVSRGQAKKALVLAGVSLARVEKAIDNIPDETARALARIDWVDSREFRRDNALISSIGNSLSLSEGEIDALFLAADAL